MGNLEKLGILVMVILVVVVGVVAITPQERVTAAFEDDVGDDRSVEPLPPPPAAKKVPPSQPSWPPSDVVPKELKSADIGPEAGAGRQPARVDPAPLPPPRSTTYTVQEGDSLFSIAKKQLGDGARWNEIVELNPALDPGDLRENDVLVLPRSAGRVQSVKDDPVRPAKSTYVVLKGDTLSGIASKQLGSAKKWRKLLDANRGLLGSPEDLREGMTITIPSVSAPRAEAPRRVSGRVYKVRDGDSLARIARVQLGKESRWKEIQRLNEDVLRGRTGIAAGMLLRLPE